MRVIFNNILIERAKEDEVTKGGIFIPEVGKERPAEGIVLEIGKDVEEVKKGDSIYFGKFTGVEIEVDGKTLLVIKEKDVFGIK